MLKRGHSYVKYEINFASAAIKSPELENLMFAICLMSNFNLESREEFLLRLVS